MCFIGALNFSCSDDDDNFIELVAEKLNSTEVKAGDELVITGTGFSLVSAENIVKLNGLVIPVIAASDSELKLVIPQEATTGNLTVTVDEKTIDFGILKVYIELVIEKISATKGKIGDEIVITGQGFSAVKDENTVEINGVKAVIIECTISELKVKISDETSKGNLIVTVNNRTVDHGVFNIMQKTLFALKTDYDARKISIVIIDPSTGEETIFLELPQLEEDYWYSDLCFLEKRNEFVLLKKSEDDVEYHIKDPKVIRINVDSKELQEIKLNVEDGVIDIDLLSDGKSNLYLKNFYEYDVAYKVTLYKFDLDTGDSMLITKVNNDYVKKCKVLDENRLMILMEDRNKWPNSSHRIVSVDLTTGIKQDVITDLKYVNGFSFGSSNNIFFASKDSRESESTLFELELTTGEKKTIVNMPNIYGWYAGAVYLEKSNELIYFLSGEDNNDDVTGFMYKVNVSDNSTKKIELKNANTFLYQSEQVIYF